MVEKFLFNTFPLFFQRSISFISNRIFFYNVTSRTFRIWHEVVGQFWFQFKEDQPNLDTNPTEKERLTWKETGNMCFLKQKWKSEFVMYRDPDKVERW